MNPWNYIGYLLFFFLLLMLALGLFIVASGWLEGFRKKWREHQALEEDLVCDTEGCYEIATWTTGYDRYYCGQHKIQYHSIPLKKWKKNAE